MTTPWRENDEFGEDIPDEEIPPGLQNKWNEDEKRGIKAGVCPECQWPFTDQDLSCRHCGHPVEVKTGVVSGIAHGLFKTPWGVVTVLIIILSFVMLIF